MPEETRPSLQQTLDGLWRIEGARLIVRLARLLGDIGSAEDVAQETILAALQHWGRDGLPDNPAAWLHTTARHRAIDILRQRQTSQSKQPLLGYAELLRQEQQAHGADLLDKDMDDDLLRLMFCACHPLLPPESRVCLALRLLCGLDTDEIGRAFLQPAATIAQRISRAKRTLEVAAVPFDLPHGEARAQRLDSVLEVIYLLFNEGYACSAGESWSRPRLCEEAMRLGRTLSTLCPQHAEVHGLSALLQLQAARLPARRDSAGEPVLLLQQNRARWDQVLLRRGFESLQRARQLRQPFGPYTLQAAIAACHAQARRAEDTEWLSIAALYDALSQSQPGPVVELNRAVAHAKAFGADAGLSLLQPLLQAPQLQNYPYLHSVHGDFLQQKQHYRAAAEAFQRARDRSENAADKRLMQQRIEQNLRLCRPHAVDAPR